MREREEKLVLSLPACLFTDCDIVGKAILVLVAG